MAQHENSKSFSLVPGLGVQCFNQHRNEQHLHQLCEICSSLGIDSVYCLACKETPLDTMAVPSISVSEIDQDKGSTIFSLTWTEGSLATIVVCARMYTRLRLVKNAGWDDWIMLFALVCIILNAQRLFCRQLMTRLGIGGDMQHFRCTGGSLWHWPSHRDPEPVPNNDGHQDGVDDPAFQHNERLLRQDFDRSSTAADSQ